MNELNWVYIRYSCKYIYIYIYIYIYTDIYRYRDKYLIYIRHSLESVYVLCMQKLSNVHEKSACKFWGSSEVNKSVYVA